MFQKRTECDQFTVMVGLMNLADHLLAEDVRTMDLTLVKERLMSKVLNFNGHLTQLCLMARRSTSVESKRSFASKVAGFFSGAKANSPERSDLGTTHCHLVSNVQSQSGSPPPGLIGSPNPARNADKTAEPLGTSSSPGPLSKYSSLTNMLNNLNRNDFFVYSASLSFNPSIKTVSDLVNPVQGGGVVFTITAKMPLEDKQQKPYLRLLLKYLGTKSVLLQVNRANPLDSILASANVAREEPTSESSAVLKPIPKYFDEDYTDEEGEKHVKEPNAAGAYSFFRHSSYLLSKYATSTLVPREDDKYVTQRLLQVKLQRGRRDTS